MPSILKVVLFIFLQLSSKNTGCYAESSYEKTSYVWDSIKEAVYKTRELPSYGKKIVGYVVNVLDFVLQLLHYGKKIAGYAVDVLYLMSSGIQSIYSGGYAIFDIIRELTSGTSISEILSYGKKLAGYAVDVLYLMYTGIQSIYAGGQAVFDIIRENTSGTSTSEMLIYGLKTLSFAAVSVVSAPYFLALAGFGAGGIAAGGFAAWFQSVWFGGTIGGISGWIFSALQSAGVVGIGTTGMTVITFFSVVATWLYECIF